LEILLDKRATKYVSELYKNLRNLIDSIDNNHRTEKYLRKAKKIMDRIRREYCVENECDSLLLLVDFVYCNIIKLVEETEQDKKPVQQVKDLAHKYLSRLEELLPRNNNKGSNVLKKIFGIV